MLCKVVSPTKTLTFRDVMSVNIPATSGRMQILKNHAETFVLLQNGTLRIKDGTNKKHEVKITNNAQCYVHKNKIVIIM